MYTKQQFDPRDNIAIHRHLYEQLLEDADELMPWAAP